jgi:predicted dehydrogenase
MTAVNPEKNFHPQRQVGIAVLGVGRWGVHWVRNLLQHPQANLVAVVDPNAERLAALQQQFHLPASVKLVSDWQQVRDLSTLEAVVIATPASTHYPLIADALKQGYHVLAEKPLTLDPTQAIELCEMAEKHQRLLVVDHTYLFHPAIQLAQQTIQTGTLGTLHYGYATRTHFGPIRADTDVLWDLAAHDLSIFNHCLGMTPVQVQATGTPLRPHSQPFSPIDLANITLTYATGFQATLHLCWCNPDKQRRLCIAGTQGTLVFDEMSTTTPLTLYRSSNELPLNSLTSFNAVAEVLTPVPVEPLQQVCQHFLHCLHTQTPSTISSGWVGVQFVQILCALTRSIQQGGVPINIREMMF